jgi:hypothetical protein
MKYKALVTSLLLLVCFMFLSVRECDRDKQNSAKKELEGDLHMLREFKKFSEQDI